MIYGRQPAAIKVNRLYGFKQRNLCSKLWRPVASPLVSLTSGFFFYGGGRRSIGKHPKVLQILIAIVRMGGLR